MHTTPGRTNAARQAAYRNRHLNEAADRERLHMLVSVTAKVQLERLARCTGQTQRAMLEQILAQTEARLLEVIPARGHDQYFGVTR